MKFRCTGSSALAMVHWVRCTPGEAAPSARDRRLPFWDSFLGHSLFSIFMLFGVAATSALAAPNWGLRVFYSLAAGMVTVWLRMQGPRHVAGTGPRAGVALTACPAASAARAGAAPSSRSRWRRTAPPPHRMRRLA